jgi:hypothetical protein
MVPAGIQHRRPLFGAIRASAAAYFEKAPRRSAHQQRLDPMGYHPRLLQVALPAAQVLLLEGLF